MNIPRLSPRQKEIAEALLRGQRDKQTAAQMGVGLARVKTGVRDISNKLLLPEVNRVRVAVKLHELRKELGVRCAMCGDR